MSFLNNTIKNFNPNSVKLRHFLFEVFMQSESHTGPCLTQTVVIRSSVLTDKNERDFIVILTKNTRKEKLQQRIRCRFFFDVVPLDHITVHPKTDQEKLWILSEIWRTWSSHQTLYISHVMYIYLRQSSVFLILSYLFSRTDFFSWCKSWKWWSALLKAIKNSKPWIGIVI